ncbi:MAG TPA: DUF2971 domain-containing protein [Xanthobacteraceae bacterium]|nr:DUF2971 domain-containing protein [Xanthobacteraceae bacterium]
MEKIPFVKAGTYLFRFMDSRTEHFWPAITDMLSEQTLFVNSRTRFNDPYDSHPIIENDLSTSAVRAYCEEMIKNPFDPKRSLTGIAHILDLKASGRTRLNKKMVENIKAEMRQATEDFLDTGGLLSFSLTAENPLLWGHYAASFAGICAIFRRSASTDSALSICASVSYVDKRPHLPMSLFHEMSIRRISGQDFDDIANDIFFLSFLHKSDHWAYEQEARIFYPFSAFQKLSFEPSELVGFILGPKSSSDLEQKMRTEIKKRRPSVALHKSSLSQNDFRIIIPHKFTQRHKHAA